MSIINITRRILNVAERGIKQIRNKLPVRSSFSNLDEQSVIGYYLEKLKIARGYCVDIAASDGITMSNTYSLYKNGWGGLAVECNAEKFSSLSGTYVNFHGVNLSKCMVTPINVVSLLQAHNTPTNFDFLNLDIDGYDYFVLEKILEVFRPKLICVEINEKIPPPIKFTVKWSPEFVWATNHFYGQSICQLDTLVSKHNYALVELHYNNAFLIPIEISPAPSLTPAEAYRSGYMDKTDRKEKFPWNADMEEVLHLEPQKALDFVNDYFKRYQGTFEASI